MAKKGLSLADFKTDEKAEVEGVWIPYNSGLEVKVARFGNKKMQKHLRKQNTGHRTYGKNLDDVSDEEVIELIADFILLDWKNLKDEDGKNLPYSRENAIRALKIKDFREEILEISMDRERYRIQKIENASKN